MNVEHSNRRRGARAVAIGARVTEAHRRLAERVLIAGAVAAALVQSAWLIQATLRAAHP